LVSGSKVPGKMAILGFRFMSGGVYQGLGAARQSPRLHQAS